MAPLPSSAGTAPSGVSASSTWSRQPETVTAGPPDLVAKSNVGNGGTEPKLSVRVLSAPPYRFNHPGAMALSGNDLFVANDLGNSITELNASTGAALRVLSGPAYRFNLTGPMVANGEDLFVLEDNRSDSVAEVDASTGALVRVISGPAYRFDYPNAMALLGDDLFVVNNARHPSVTELNASTGALVRVISARPTGSSTRAPWL